MERTSQLFQEVPEGGLCRYRLERMDLVSQVFRCLLLRRNVRIPHSKGQRTSRRESTYANANRSDMLKYLKMTMVNTASLARDFKQRIPSENVLVPAQLKHTIFMCNYSQIVVRLMGVLSTFWTHFLLK